MQIDSCPTKTNTLYSVKGDHILSTNQARFCHLKRNVNGRFKVSITIMLRLRCLPYLLFKLPKDGPRKIVDHIFPTRHVLALNTSNGFLSSFHFCFQGAHEFNGCQFRKSRTNPVLSNGNVHFLYRLLCGVSIFLCEYIRGVDYRHIPGTGRSRAPGWRN